jgi:heptosyltransferase II
VNPHPASRIPHPARVVVRGVNWLGDAVMSTPALLRLRERFPDAHITLLTHEKLRDLWLNHPAVDETIPFGTGDGVFSVGRKLRAGNFDLALVLPNSPRSAMEVWLAGIPKRIGYARPWRNWFLTQTVATKPGHVRMHKRSVGEIKRLVADFQRRTGVAPVSKIISEELETGATPVLRPNAHQIHEYLHLVASLGADPTPLPPRLEVGDDEVQAVEKKFGLTDAASGKRPVFGLNPGAEYGPAKRWPIARFIAAAREIQQRTNCVWLILGGKGDIEIAAQIASVIRHSSFVIRDLSGQTSLRELMAALKLCRVLLTNDTGPMHVAAALGTPVVVPFGSTSPELTGPGLPGDSHHRLIKSDAPCSPCFLRECPIDFRCMNDISVERVVEAVLDCAGRA